MLSWTRTSVRAVSSGALRASAATKGPALARQMDCAPMKSLTMAETSDCLMPGAQYSRAADGGLPGVARPARQREDDHPRPTSLTAAKRTPFGVDWRAMLRLISAARVRSSALN